MSNAGCLYTEIFIYGVLLVLVSAVCESLPQSAGAELNLSSDGIQTYAQFTCEIGYTMVGNGTVYCRSDGSWTMQPPTCGIYLPARKF